MCNHLCGPAWSKQFGKLINWTHSENLIPDADFDLRMFFLTWPWAGDWWSLKCWVAGPGATPVTSQAPCVLSIRWWSRHRPEPATSDAEWRLILDSRIIGKSSSHQDGIMISGGPLDYTKMALPRYTNTESFFYQIGTIWNTQSSRGAADAVTLGLSFL